MYYNIGEYSLALKFVRLYIKANDKNAGAFNILAQCYAKLKRPERQLRAYQRSLKLDNWQTDILIEVYQLLRNKKLTHTQRTHDKNRQLDASVSSSFVGENQSHNVEETMRLMVESIDILKENIIGVCTRLQNIEDRLNNGNEINNIDLHNRMTMARVS